MIQLRLKLIDDNFEEGRRTLLNEDVTALGEVEEREKDL